MKQIYFAYFLEDAEKIYFAYISEGSKTYLFIWDLTDIVV
jgi:hypothetical protein